MQQLQTYSFGVRHILVENILLQAQPITSGFGRAGKDTNYSTEAVPYLVPNDASKSKYRGSGGGYSYTWLSLEAPRRLVHQSPRF